MEPHLQQGSQEWLDWRKNKVMASEIPIIMEKSPWCTPHLLWKRKLGFSAQQPDNYAMKRGRDLEPVVRDLANKELNANFVPAVVINKDLDWAGASLDGLDLENKAILEIKCINTVDHQTAKDGKIPEKYKDQVQWQLFCSGLKTCYYVSYCKKDQDIITVEVGIDESYIENELLPAAKAFYKCIVDMVEPAKGEDDYVQIDDEEFGKCAEDWIKANEDAKLYAEREKFYRNKLIDFSDDGNCKGYGVKLKRVDRAGSVNWKSIWDNLEKLHPEIASKFSIEEYRSNQVGYWKITADKKV